MTSRRSLLLVMTAAFALALALGAAYFLMRDDPSGYASQDLDGRTVEWDRRPDAEGSAVRETGERFEVASVDLSVPLLSAVVANGEINPPTLTDAFWYRETAELGGPGTSVIALHAVRGGRGPGNALVDVEGANPALRVHPGDLLDAGSVRYQVTGTMIASKQETAADPRIWGESDHDALAVITCVPTDDRNAVIFATAVGNTE
ncbi:class F sortase [Aeromicrobium tamlense]|uniref:Class F sortase n=1 Tax=Aeromicrobium tamlense TaxID=375541 RepID=A0A8I0FZE9_9ACTN|nr:class F sortase [Aeromicrobium tamlense]MBD1270732.1 class F sortase [Aeromicrobium tamlense]MBD1271136.1 class F sortase [Aeromicrobium tamlense]NYI38124.1 hypothetical protein [Aeromicrobium tamlense]